jgi:hypothetical protein
MIASCEHRQVRAARNIADIPQTNISVFTTARQPVTARIKSNTPDAIGISLQGSEAIPTADLPRAARLIIATARQQIASAIESDRPHPMRMTLQNSDTTPRRSVPETNRVILTATGY